jgi:hypothetical protein
MSSSSPDERPRCSQCGACIEGSWTADVKICEMCQDATSSPVEENELEQEMLIQPVLSTAVSDLTNNTNNVSRKSLSIEDMIR